MPDCVNLHNNVNFDYGFANLTTNVYLFVWAYLLIHHSKTIVYNIKCVFIHFFTLIHPSVDSSSFDAPIHVNLFFAIVCYWPCWNIFWIYHIAWTTIFCWQTFTRLRLNSTTNIIERYLHFDIELNFYPFQGLLIHYYLLFFEFVYSLNCFICFVFFSQSIQKYKQTKKQTEINIKSFTPISFFACVRRNV